MTKTTTLVINGITFEIKVTNDNNLIEIKGEAYENQVKVLGVGGSRPKCPS